MIKNKIKKETKISFFHQLLQVDINKTEEKTKDKNGILDWIVKMRLFLSGGERRRRIHSNVKANRSDQDEDQGHLRDTS